MDRQAVYDKCDGHCAYCGCELPFNKMQVDHYEPQFLKHFKPDEDNNHIDNLLPSCQPCNIHKHAWRPEDWRNELSRQVEMLSTRNAQFKRAVRFGQVKILDRPIVFYFENNPPSVDTKTK